MKHVMVLTAAAVMLVVGPSAQAMVPMHGSITYEAEVSGRSRAEIHAMRFERRQHREAVHDRRTFNRKTKVVGTVPLGTFHNTLPAHYDPTLLAWRGTVLSRQAMAAYYTALDGNYVHGGGYRSNAQQSSMYAANSSMLAPPGTSYHEVGLAVDVFNLSASQRAAMYAAGFRQVRSDEPWHFSWRVEG